jgi:MFS family permease
MSASPPHLLHRDHSVLRRPMTAARLRRNLHFIYSDGMAYSVMVGAGETYIAAFALALGMHQITAGLLASVPMLAGAVLQLISPWAVTKLRSHRKWVVLCAIVQASTFLPLILAAALGSMDESLLFLVVAVYWGASLATGPAWNTWVETLVPKPVRAMFFARRARVAHLVVLAALVAAGLALQFGRSRGEEPGAPLYSFAAIFALAMASRFWSATFLFRQTEPRPLPHGRRDVGVIELLSRSFHGADGKLLVYMLAVRGAMQISAPFLTPYMLGQLQFSYAQYLALIAASYTAKFLVLPHMASLVRAAGAQRTLWITGISIVPLSALWCVSDSFVYLLAAQLISGAMWAGYELATFLLLFETIRHEERTSVLTTFNAAHAVVTVGGALLGGAILGAMDTQLHGYMAIFLLAALASALTLLLLRRVHIATPAVHPLPLRTTAVRPGGGGSIERPIIASLSDQAPPRRQSSSALRAEEPGLRRPASSASGSPNR